MRQLPLLALLLAALTLTAAAPPPAAAEARGCNNTMVNAGLCRVNTNVLWSWDASPAASADLRDAALWRGGYATEVPCARERVVTRGILEQAGVTQGDCTAGQLGTQIPNPQTPLAFANAVLRNQLVDLVRDYRRHLQTEAEEAARPEITDPDLGGADE